MDTLSDSGIPSLGGKAGEPCVVPTLPTGQGVVGQGRAGLPGPPNSGVDPIAGNSAEQRGRRSRTHGTRNRRLRKLEPPLRVRDDTGLDEHEGADELKSDDATRRRHLQERSTEYPRDRAFGGGRSIAARGK